MSIPADPTFTNCTSGGLDLSTTANVNGAIDGIKGQMVAQGWTLSASYFPSCTISLGLPLVGTRSVGFSIVFNSYFGWRVRFFDSSLGELGGHLFPDYFIDSAGALNQTVMATRLATGMMDINPNYSVVVVIDGGGNPSTLLVTGTISGPSLNDGGPMAGNILTGTQANAIPKGGGWQMTSAAANGNSRVVVAITNTFLDTLTINASINGHAIAQKLIERRSNYLSVVDPYQWVLWHMNDGTTYSNGTIFTQYNDYWLCAPNVAIEQRTAAVSPLTYCAFEMIASRGQLNTANVVATALNSSFQDTTFGAFPNVDQGFSMILLNSMQTAAGALTTTADKVIQTQALVALAPATGSPMVLVGDIWDMFITTQFYAQDSRAIGPGGRDVIAYRSQNAPCTATLWVATN